ncbi:hypothetical protein L7F22_026598 [Adiantum nelumboides]|nr:hypothetical protein [Adiantum nelumboides]
MPPAPILLWAKNLAMVLLANLLQACHSFCSAFPLKRYPKAALQRACIFLAAHLGAVVESSQAPPAACAANHQALLHARAWPLGGESEDVATSTETPRLSRQPSQARLAVEDLNHGELPGTFKPYPSAAFAELPESPHMLAQPLAVSSCVLKPAPGLQLQQAPNRTPPWFNIPTGQAWLAASAAHGPAGDPLRAPTRPFADHAAAASTVPMRTITMAPPSFRGDENKPTPDGTAVADADGVNATVIDVFLRNLESKDPAADEDPTANEELAAKGAIAPADANAAAKIPVALFDAALAEDTTAAMITAASFADNVAKAASTHIVVAIEDAAANSVANALTVGKPTRSWPLSDGAFLGNPVAAVTGDLSHFDTASPDAMPSTIYPAAPVVKSAQAEPATDDVTDATATDKTAAANEANNDATGPFHPADGIATFPIAHVATPPTEDCAAATVTKTAVKLVAAVATRGVITATKADVANATAILAAMDDGDVTPAISKSGAAHIAGDEVANPTHDADVVIIVFVSPTNSLLGTAMAAANSADEGASEETPMLVNYLITRLQQAMANPALQGEVQQQLQAYGDQEEFVVCILFLAKNDLRVIFEDDRCIVRDRENGYSLITTGTLENGLFVLDRYEKQIQACIAETKTQAMQDAEMWHARFGHVGYGSLMTLQRHNMVHDLSLLEMPPRHVCEGCVLGKMHRFAFSQDGSVRATRKLQLVHSDVCGPMRTPSVGNSLYFVTLIDDFSRFCWVYPLKAKSDVFAVFQHYVSMVENETGCKVQTLCTDRGGEYMSGAFKDFLGKKGIKHQCTMPYTPQQNGVAERKNRSLMEMARCMLKAKSLPHKLWMEAVACAAHVLNRCPTRALKTITPYESWYDRKPSVSYLRVFGCLAYAHIPQQLRGKLDDKAVKCIFVGYSSGSKGYRLYNPATNKIFESRDVIFAETTAQPMVAFDVPHMQTQDVFEGFLPSFVGNKESQQVDNFDQSFDQHVTPHDVEEIVREEQEVLREERTLPKWVQKTLQDSKLDAPLPRKTRAANSWNSKQQNSVLVSSEQDESIEIDYLELGLAKMDWL